MTYPLISNNYFVILDDYITSFSKVSGMSLKSDEFTAISEGGNDRPYILPNQNGNFETITFEKGVILSENITLNNDIKVVLIIITDRKRQIEIAYTTDIAIVKSLKLSDLEASNPSVLIESMTILYNQLSQVKDIDNINFMLSVKARGKLLQRNSEVNSKNVFKETSLEEARNYNKIINEKNKNLTNKAPKTLKLKTNIEF